MSGHRREADQATSRRGAVVAHRTYPTTPTPAQPDRAWVYARDHRLILVNPRSKWRVQLEVFDFTGPPTPEALRRLRPSFRVCILPIHAPRSAAYNTGGREVYRGTDAMEALDWISRAFGLEIYPKEDFPRRFGSYFEEA